MTEIAASPDGTLERTPDGGVIRFERHLPYPVEAVWDAITSPACRATSRCSATPASSTCDATPSAASIACDRSR